MEHIKEIKKHTAVFAVSDYYAMDFITFLKSEKISVPEDMSVVGFDDERECEKFVPPLTTVRQSSEKRAYMAVKVLEQLKAGEDVEKNIKLPVELAERESVCNIKNAQK